MLTIHIASKHTTVDGKSCRKYRGYDADRNPLFTAVAFGMSGKINIGFDNETGEPEWKVKPRWNFPVTGKHDVVEAKSGTIVCIAKRNGTLTDANDVPLAQFKNAKSFKSELAEGMFDAIVNAALVGDGNDAPGSGSGAFVLLVDGRTDGSFTRGRLPFMVDPPKPPPTSGIGRFARKILPESWTEARPPLGWNLSLGPSAETLNQRFVIAQSLVTAELNRC